MLDVLHFFFEQDSRYGSAEEAESVSTLRTSLYRNLYDTTYNYGSSSNSAKTTAGNDYFTDPNVVKPYIPPTEFNPDSFNPYGSVLDAPIG